MRLTSPSAAATGDGPTPLQLPGRKHFRRGIEFYGAILRPWTANDGELDIVALGEYRGIGQIFKFVEAGCVCRSSSVIMDKDAIPESL